MSKTINPNRGEGGRELVWDTEGSTLGDYACRRCSGTGRFITYVENGQPRGPGGRCFRCGGKGYHSQGDRRRNLGYDKHAACGGM